MGLLEGKLAVISGAARGQGRSHAIRLAEEGADIIALDLCGQVETVSYPMSTEDDLEQTKKAVETLGRRIITSVTDVRDAEATAAAVQAGIAKLGQELDIVVANAGIVQYLAAHEIGATDWHNMISINLTGVWNLVSASLTSLKNNGRGGSIVMTSSSAAHVGVPHLAHYSAAKAGLVGLMQSLAVELGPHMIRVNTVHPTGTNTPMLQNKATWDTMLGITEAEGAGKQTEVDPENVPEAIAQALIGLNALPIKWVDAIDISNAVLYLVSDMSRYVTGLQLKVDGGSAVK